MAGRPRGWLVVVLALACGCARSDSEAPLAAAAAPAALQLEAETSGRFYRYVDPESGSVATAAQLEDVPAAARAEVVVFDEAQPTPPGWEQVADLSRGFPTTTTPTAGFVLRPRSAAAGSPAVAPKARRRGSGHHEVVMFSTQGCGYCRKARRFFEQRRVPFTEYDLERDRGAQAKLAEMGARAGAAPGSLRGVPILFIDGGVIVGWDERQVARKLGL